MVMNTAAAAVVMNLAAVVVVVAAAVVKTATADKRTQPVYMRSIRRPTEAQAAAA